MNSSKKEKFISRLLNDRYNNEVDNNQYVDELLNRHKSNPLSLHYLGDSMKELFDLLDSGRINPSELDSNFKSLINKVNNVLTADNIQVTMGNKPNPLVVTERWKSRDKKRKESIVDFIARVYGSWLGDGLIQADIRKVDMPLYNAFQQWIYKGNVPPKWFNLPKKSEEKINYPTKKIIECEKESRAIKARLKYRENNSISK